MTEGENGIGREAVRDTPESSEREGGPPSGEGCSVHLLAVGPSFPV